MISNLSAYNNHKRATLDRVAAKYTQYVTDVFEQHLKSNKSKIESAIKSDKSSVDIPMDNIKKKLLEVFDDHRKYTIYVGVSDAMREEGKNNKLSYMHFPLDFPVEFTITQLAEIKKRDLISRMINAKIDKRAKKIIEKIIDRKLKGYFRTIEEIYRAASKKYRDDEKTTDTRKTVIDIIKRVTGAEQKRAETIFRTETTRYFNKSRIDYFTKYGDTDFIQLVAVTDGRISNICESRDMYVIPVKDAKLKKFMPPFHPNCRTIQSPLDTDLKSDENEVRKNLGLEFGTVVSQTSGKKFTGKRPKPSIPLPKGWA